jgi:hypothetical protein
MLKSCIAAVCLIVVLSGISWAGPGDVKWSAQYQAGANGTVIGMACQGNYVYTTGFYYDLAGTASDAYTALIAYNATTGAAVWSDAGESGLTGPIRAAGGKVYTAGKRVTTESGVAQNHLFVNAYTSKGTVEWQRYWLDSGARIINDIQVASNKVIAGGNDGSGYFGVTALSASKGNILWEAAGNAGSVNAVAVDSGKVFAVGYLSDPANYREKWTVRAYNLSTGALVWEDTEGTAGTSGSANNSGALAVVAGGGRVYVAGTLYTDDVNGGGASFAVRAYDAKTGGLVWRDYYDLYSYFDDAANTIYLQGGKVFAGGYVTRSSGGKAFVVRAYSASKGAPLWTNLTGGYDVEENSVEALTGLGSAIYAAGALTKDYYTGFATKGYHMSKGTILWQSYIDSQTPGAAALTPIAAAICGTGGTVFSGGTSSVAGAGQAFTVQANSR